MDPRVKIVLTVLYVVAVFLTGSLIGYAALTAFVLTAIFLSRVGFGTVMRALKPLLFIIIFTTVINLFFNSTGNTVLSWWIIRITDAGIINALRISYRLTLLITGTALLTLTTNTVDLTDALERLLRPMKLIRFPVHELAMMMTIALRFIPTLMEETDRIMKAQKARGADFETGGALKRAKAMVPLLIPLFVSAFRIASDLALAMEARCYHGGEGRTRMKTLRLGRLDLWAGMAFCVVAAAVVCDQCGLFAFADNAVRGLIFPGGAL
ncbi:MAG: energy-coupling factor transporter transmembrane protein EcfT [Eubacteriales bacterium]|nr:energy-coupling factor transporter transmembrane protein EcfT [Eubacteriales bacterium]